MNRSGRLSHERVSEIIGVLVLGFTTLLFLALVTDEFHTQGQSGRFIEGMTETPNLLGAPGAAVAAVLAIVFGDASHVLYAIAFLWGLMLCTHRPLDRFLSRLSGLLILTCSVAGLLQLNLSAGSSNPQAGGAIGAFVMDQIFAPRFGRIGANIVGATLTIIGTLLATDFLFVHVLIAANRLLTHLIRGSLALFEGVRSLWRGQAARRAMWKAHREALQEAAPFEEPGSSAEEDSPSEALQTWIQAEKDNLERMRIRPEKTETQAALDALPFEAPEPAPEAEPALPEALVVEEEEPSTLSEAEAPAVQEDETPAQLEFDAPAEEDRPAPSKPRPVRRSAEEDELPEDYVYPRFYTRPPLSMLDESEIKPVANLAEYLRQTGLLLEETLGTFNIEARVTDITRGPTITRFELEPAPGIKVSRFLALADDIALALKAQRVRVEAPIPGKGRVGIEVPNRQRDPVVIRELLESRSFSRGNGKLNLALGKDIAGDVSIADLASMPHLLVAGATGAGKTVCVKSLLASLLFQHTPDEMQLMLIDPKMVELSIFNDIPHLITPVVTDPKKAASALCWLITEMEERYRLFADLRVRNIEVYNQSVENGEIEMEGGEDHPESLHVIRKLPYIVCIIDELADLMMLARAEVEDAIARLAQLARAVGIHLIIATQRPSVDVLTGVIKANFPARLSFQVSSRVDSRCILDEIGAERLIGMGDMLYLPAGQSKPTRLQGAFVSDEEMNALIAYLKRQAPPQYRDEIERFGKGKDSTIESIDEDDPLLDEAVQVVLETGQASISMVQTAPPGRVYSGCPVDRHDGNEGYRRTAHRQQGT